MIGMWVIHFCIALVVIVHVVQSTTVETESGFVSSDVVRMSRNGISFHSFLGIPYAAPPVGELRFKPPEEHPKWDGVRDASEFGSPCTQWQHPSQFGNKIKTVLGSEDCLYVNVYTKKANAEQHLLPVLVFIHGGAFMSGKGSSKIPDNIMDWPLVLVTFNYRLGVFGFLSSGDRLILGNAGLKDQLELLKWVRNNIRAFGGDPECVTLMGHSAGASGVHQHTLAPRSKGLFHRAIILGGNAVSFWSYFPRNSKYERSLYEEMVNRTNCWSESQPAIVECLKGLTKEELSRAEHELVMDSNTMVLFRPIVEPFDDKSFLLADPRKLNYANTKMPILFSLCSSESAFFMDRYLKKETHMKTEFEKDLPTMINFRGWVTANNESNISEQIFKFYFPGTNFITKKNAKEILRMFDDTLLKMSMTDVILNYPGKKFVYLFDFTNSKSALKNPLIEAANCMSVSGASHGEDLFFLRYKITDLTSEDARIADQIMKYYVSFIYSGNPNSNEINGTYWSPANDSRHFEYMSITEKGFKMDSNFVDLRSYDFYKSLPISWLPIKTDTNGTTATITNYICYLIVPLIIYVNEK